jgi:hypothetical protein
MLDVFATILGLVILGIAGYGVWRFSQQGFPKPPR